GTGILLPAYDEIGSRIVKGGVGEMSLAQYAYELRTTTLLTMTRSRVRYGAEFEQSAGSAFFTGGSVSYSAAGALGVFQKAGETFQVYETGRVDPDGHKIYRLSQFWQDSLSTPYWSRLNSDQPITGYAFLESFVQPRDAWCTAIGVRISRKPADGLLWAGLCECVNGVPDITRMIALVSQPATFFTPEGGFGMNKVAIPPTFLQGGRSYAYVVMTGADYYHQVVETGTSPTTGTMFYGLNGGVLQSDPTRHLMFDLYYATFRRNRVEVDLGGMSLAGGIASIDILADAIVPDSTVLEYQVQIGGVWKALSESAASILAGLPNLLPLRVVMTGTADAMPGLKLAGSRCRFSRPATALNHYSEVATLAAPTSKITTRHRIRNFDTGQHALTTKILVGAGYATVETADVVQDTVRGDITERVCTFNLAA
ncbi:hypothetical protein, partial [Bosea sp. CRIB-10]|uniref:hypothetical protein n=1 Tax=Bosea sp. CRIB-10 TaxID=378404 RepID=UPI00158744B7